MMHLIENEMRRRAKTREIESDLDDEAEYLKNWGASNHPDGPPTTEKTIKNRLRELHRSLVTL